MPLYGPATSDIQKASAIGFFNVNPVAQPTGYSSSYVPASKTMGSYTSNGQGTAYTVGVLNLLAAAQGSDVNALRVAYENLRAFAENVAQQHNQLVTDLKSLGLIGS